jgi:hypothetical protein
MVIGDIFVSYGPLFKLYCQYAKGYDAAVSIIKEYENDARDFLQTHKKRKALFSKKADESEFNLHTFLTQTMNSEACGGKPLQSFLILPIQRVPRYELMLKTVLKYTDKDHEDHAFLLQAISEVHKAVAFIEFHLENMKLRSRLREIEELFGGSIALIDTIPRREQLRTIFKDETLRCWKLNKGKKEEALHFFLFDDILVTSSMNSDGSHRLVDAMTLTECGLEDALNSRQGTFGIKVHEQLCFTIISETSVYLIEAKSASEKKEWIDIITSNVMKEKLSAGLKLFKGMESDSEKNDEDEEQEMISDIQRGIRIAELKQARDKFQKDLPILKDKDSTVISGIRYIVKEGLLYGLQNPEITDSISAAFVKENKKRYYVHLLSDYLIFSSSLQAADHSTGTRKKADSLSGEKRLKLAKPSADFSLLPVDWGSMSSTAPIAGSDNVKLDWIEYCHLSDVVFEQQDVKIENSEEIVSTADLEPSRSPSPSPSPTEDDVKSPIVAEQIYSIHIKTPHNVFLLLTESETTKSDWISHLKTCKMYCQQLKLTAKDESAQERKIDSKSCFLCKKVFTLMTRKHVCKKW